MEKGKLVLLIAILLASLILGGSYYASEVSKQQSIERQQQIELQARTEQTKEASYFKNQTECETYSKVIKDDIDKDNLSPFSLGESSVFEMIFYSPKDNSCLYATQRISDKGEREYFVFNFLAKSKITSFRFPEQFGDYKRFILEYSDGKIRL